MNLEKKYKNRESNRRNNTSVTLVCKECNKMFTTTVGNICWHYDVGNLIPAFCDDCKKTKKETREKKFQELKEKRKAQETTEVVEEEKLIGEN